MTDPFDSLRRPPSGAEPDVRFVDDVLARVAGRLDDAATGRDRAPQQGALRPTTAPVDLEVVPMLKPSTPSRRPVVWLAAAAVIALVVVGIATLTKDDSSTGSTTSDPTTVAPTTQPVANPVAIPEELRGRWMTTPRETVGAGEGSSLLLTGGVYSVSVSNRNDSEVIGGALLSAEGDSFSVSTGAGLSNCEKNDVGRYSWSVNASGRVLTVTLGEDPCERRSKVLPGTYWRMGCVDPSDNCLGLLDAGTYGSQFISPLLPSWGSWRAVYGGLTYTVPDGWANYADWPRSFGLTTADAFASTTSGDVVPAGSIEVITTVAPLSSACGGDVAIVDSLDAAVDAIRSVDGVTTTEPASLTIGGHEARWIDLSVEAGTSPDCTGAPIVETFAGGGGSIPWSRQSGAEFIGTESDVHWGIAPGERQRLVVIDVGDGELEPDGRAQLVGVLVRDVDGQGFDTLVAESMPIIQSFQFA